MTGLVLRDARRGEVAAIVKMLADDELGRAREEIGDPLPAPYYEAYEEIGRDPNNRLLVAEVRGEIVGTLQLTFIRGLSRKAARRAQIEAVRVAGPHRGTGLGEQMIRAAIEIARNAGCSIVQLTTDKRRADAHRFYERLGFVASHEGMKFSLD
jgi:GNAT superfamily N-acetyltransferase